MQRTPNRMEMVERMLFNNIDTSFRRMCRVPRSHILDICNRISVSTPPIRVLNCSFCSFIPAHTHMWEMREHSIYRHFDVF